MQTSIVIFVVPIFAISSLAPREVSLPFVNMSESPYQKYYTQIFKKPHQTVDDDYTKAIDTLNLLHINYAEYLTSKTPEFLNGRLDQIRSFLSLCDVDLRQLENNLQVIHVTGTKGKGSTCTYCASILHKYGLKTGLFSTPHLVSVRERIRVNGRPISREQFARCFWDVYQILENRQMTKNAAEEMPSDFAFTDRPITFTMALKIFLEEQVDVAIIEVGIGGEYDYTNIFSKTAVVGISSIGLDHVQIFGNTVEKIAFQKSGIMKSNCISIASPDQPKDVLRVLEQRAIEKKCDFFVAPAFDSYSFPDADVKLGIEGSAQKHNASLAVQLVSAVMKKRELQTYHGPSFQLSKIIVEGLTNCRWPGRTQLLNYSHNLAYYLDGAHTLESMQNCVSWYQNAMPQSSGNKRVLVFNMTGHRDAKSIMKLLLPLQFDYVIFCPNRNDNVTRELSADNTSLCTSRDIVLERVVSYRQEWIQLNEKFDGNSAKLFHDVSAVHEFLEQLSDNEKLHVLITGSLHLVGAFLTLFDPDLEFSFKIC